MVMTPIEANRAAVFAQCGRTVLWVGNEAHSWGPNNWRACGEFARSLGVDSICAKVGDGSIKWYGTPANLLKNIRDVVLSTGAGFIPFIYCYGPKFGMGQVSAETAVLREILTVCPIAQADMEAEYNNNPTAAALFEAEMRPAPGMLSVSTWADPVQQQWIAVADKLAPCVNQWTLQQYNDWLAAQESQYNPAIFSCIAPGVDLTAEFGTNHPLNIAHAAKAHGHQTLYIWEYQAAKANPALVRQLVAIMAS
jgi:hypothetical protein